MFTLVLILLLVGLTLGAALFVGGLFVQGYIYTEPSPHLTWGAPIAGAVLFLFYSAWCLAVAFSTPSAENSTYHVIWQFSPTVNQFRVPVKEAGGGEGRQEGTLCPEEGRHVRGPGTPRLSQRRHGPAVE